MAPWGKGYEVGAGNASSAIYVKYPSLTLKIITVQFMAMIYDFVDFWIHE